MIISDGLPTLVGADQFVSLVVDDENDVGGANTALVDRDTELGLLGSGRA